MDKWDLRFLDMAKLVASWSKDPSTGIGAVITDQRNRVLSVGFNGLPRGIDDSELLLNNRQLKYKTIIHAEENALLFANGSVRGSTVYVWPMPPCSSCCSKLIQSEVARVVSVLPTPELQERWGESYRISLDMFAEAGVQVVLFDE